MLHLILGGCGTGKSTKLMRSLSEAVSAGKKTALLIPEQFSFEGEKKLYEQIGAQAFNVVETYSFQTLAREILRQAGSSRTAGYASEQEKLLYLWQAAHECAAEKLLESLEKRVDTSEFVLMLSNLVTKIRKSGVCAEQLIEAAASLPDRAARKTQDLGQILLRYDRILAEHGRNDSLVNLTEAAKIAQTGDFFREREFYIDEFDSFTGDQIQLLTVMLSTCPTMTAAIRAEESLRLLPDVFLGGNKTVRTLERIANDAGIPIEREFLKDYRRSDHKDLALLSKSILRPHTETLDEAPHIHLATAADPNAEVEYVCAQICELLSRGEGLRCRDIAVVVKDPALYDPLLQRAMERFALPFDCSEARPVLHTDLTRHTLTLLELLSAREWHTETILRYVKSPFSGYSSEYSGMLEHFCFTWGIDGEAWDKPFCEEGETANLTQNFGGERLEKLRVRLMRELHEMRDACQGRTVRVVCGEIFDHLARKKKAFDAVISSMDASSQNEFVMIWNLLCDMLDTLVTGFGNEKLPMRHIYEQLLLLVQSSSFSVPPQTLDSIQIADAQMVRLDAPKIVFVLGAVEGEFPADVKPKGLFTESELTQLESRNIAISRLLPELHSDELLIVAKLLSAASHEIWLTAPKRDVDGAECVASPVFGEIQSLFPRDTHLWIDADKLPVRFYVRTMAAGYEAYVRRMHEDTPELASLRAILMADPIYRARLEKLTTEPKTPSAQPRTMQEALGEQIQLSPSGIEMFHQCAYAYFCRYVLGLYIPEAETFSYRNIGNFAHYCLEQILRDTPMTEFLSLDENELGKLISGYATQFSKDNFSESIRRSGRFRMSYQAAGDSLLELLVHMQEIFRNEEFRPEGFEVVVKKDPEIGEFPPLSLEDGHILCTGKIDRVDVCTDENANLLRVVDYKTGDKSLVPEKLYFGLDMQMLIYLFALEQHGAFGHANPSGVLYLPSGQLRANQYAARSRENRERSEIMDEHFQSRGLLTEAAADHMEPLIRESAVPVLTAKTGQSLFTVTDAQMQHLEQYVKKTICSMAHKLENGEISPVPCRLPEADPCRYCKYGDLCGAKQDDTPHALKAEEKNAMRMEVFEGKEVTDGELDEPTA